MEEHYPFTLQGSGENYSGTGWSDGETYRSPEFELEQGIVIAEIEHDGQGEFRLEFVPAEGFSRGEATVASLGGSVAAGIATGAVVGSVVPGAGTILVGLIGGAVGWLMGRRIGDAVGPTIWRAIEHVGEAKTCRLMQVNKSEKGCLNPGKYRLEVKSQSRWSCRFIQPALNQSVGPLTDEDNVGGEDDISKLYFIPFLTDDEWKKISENDSSKELVRPGAYIMGPGRSGRRPLLAKIKHDGREMFNVEAFSVDGTHYSAVVRQQGQFYVEDFRTNIRPGKEYMLFVYAAGPWTLHFVERH